MDASPVFDVSVDGVQVLAWLAKTGLEVRRFRKTCQCISERAAVLKSIVEVPGFTMQDAWSGPRMAALLQVLRDFVQQCTMDFNVAQLTCEVVWRKKLPKMMEQTEDCIGALILENTVNNRLDIAQLAQMRQSEMDGFRDPSHQMDADAREDRQKMEPELMQVRQVLELIREERMHDREPEVRIAFDENDERLKTHADLTSHTTVPGTLQETIKVNCLWIGGPNWPQAAATRYRLVYKQISAKALVHQFYGIAKRGEQYWAVMQDLSECPTLAKFLAGIPAGPENVQLRISLACDITKTIAYLHSVNIVVKSITDHDIVVQKDGETYRPLITNLQRARKILGQTDILPLDVRYEAPECQKPGFQEHTTATDVWSLGIIIWQCLTAFSPFNIADPVRERDHPSKSSEIRRTMSESEAQCSLGSIAIEPKLKSVLEKIVRGCLKNDASLRSSAGSTAMALYSCLADCPTIHEGRADEAMRTLAHRSLTENKPLLEEHQVAQLRQSAESGDPFSSYVLGALTLEGIVATADTLQDPELGITASDMLKVSRARIAVALLDFAVAAGIREAVPPAKTAHNRLAWYYSKLESRWAPAAFGK